MRRGGRREWRCHACQKEQEKIRPRRARKYLKAGEFEVPVYRELARKRWDGI